MSTSTTGTFDPAKVVEQLTGGFEAFTTPAREMTEIALKNAEKLAQAQIESYRNYASIGLDNVKAALEVKEGAQAQEYVLSQRDVAKKMSDQLATDLKTFAELSSNLMTAAQKSTQQVVDKATKPAPKAKG